MSADVVRVEDRAVAVPSLDRVRYAATGTTAGVGGGDAAALSGGPARALARLDGAGGLVAPVLHSPRRLVHN